MYWQDEVDEYLKAEDGMADMDKEVMEAAEASYEAMKAEAEAEMEAMAAETYEAMNAVEATWDAEHPW